jgi:hypothetical protein
VKKSREDLRRLAEGVLRGLPKQPPTRLYQKVVLAVLVLGALIGLIGALFFR